MGQLSSHVLDTVNGVPAAQLRIELFRIDGEASTQLADITTNADGRTDQPLLNEQDMAEGHYELRFHIGEYFRQRVAKDSGAFLDVVPVRFIISDTDAKYHVPLLASPWSYTTYRGS